jgi:hypothetical protein
MSISNSVDNAKGKILRVKKGYNPNSSSMGSIVFVLPAALLAATVGFGAVSGIILSAFIKRDDKTAESDGNKVPKKIEKQEGQI